MRNENQKYSLGSLCAKRLASGCVVALLAVSSAHAGGLNGTVSTGLGGVGGVLNGGTGGITANVTGTVGGTTAAATATNAGGTAAATAALGGVGGTNNNVAAAGTLGADAQNVTLGVNLGGLSNTSGETGVNLGGANVNVDLNGAGGQPANSPGAPDPNPVTTTVAEFGGGVIGGGGGGPGLAKLLKLRCPEILMNAERYDEDLVRLCELAHRRR